MEKNQVPLFLSILLILSDCCMTWAYFSFLFSFFFGDEESAATRAVLDKLYPRATITWHT